MQEQLIVEAVSAMARLLFEVESNAQAKEMAKVREKNSELKYQLDTANQHLDQVSADYEALKDVLNSKRADQFSRELGIKAEAAEEKRQVEENLATLTGINSDLLRQLEAVEAKLASTEKERDWLKLELETANNALAEKGQPLSEEEADDYTQTIQANVELATELEQTCEALEAERLTVEDLRNKLAEAEKRCLQQQGIIAGFEAKLKAPSADTPAETKTPEPPRRLQPDGTPAAEEAGPESPAEGEPWLLNMEEFSKALRLYIEKEHKGSRGRALKAMGFTIPSAVNQTLLSKKTGTMRSKHAARFAKFLGPQILAKAPGQGPAA